MIFLCAVIILHGYARLKKNNFTHIYIYSLNDVKLHVPLNEAIRFLDAPDHLRLAPVVSPSRVLEIVYGNYLLKRLLSRYLLKSADEIKIERTAYGKPFVSTEADALYFNVSHSENMLVICIADKNVGVDIEVPKKRSLEYLKKVALHNYTKIEANAIIRISNLTSLIKYFYGLWVCKEAAIKTLGLGLSFAMNKVDSLKVLDFQGLSINVGDEIYCIKGMYKYFACDNAYIAVAKCGALGQICYFRDVC